MYFCACELLLCDRRLGMVANDIHFAYFFQKYNKMMSGKQLRVVTFPFYLEWKRHHELVVSTFTDALSFKYEASNIKDEKNEIVINRCSS